MSKPIRVLCVFSCLDRGGAETMCMNLYKKIDKTKVQFDFIKHTHNTGAYEKEIRAMGGRIFEAPKLHLTNYPQYKKWWKKHLEAHPEHLIIHVHFFTITAAIASVAHRFNRKVIGHSHACIKVDTLKSFVFRAIIRFGGKRVDYALACSMAAGEFMYGNKKYFVLKNAIDAEQFRYDKGKEIAARKELKIPENALVLGTVGRVEAVKNPNAIFEIYKQINKRIENVYLIWVGDGKLKEQTESLFEKEGLLEKVIFTGVRSDVNCIIQAFDVFLFPSFYEGLGVAAIESQTAGIQTICSNNIPKEVAITDRCTFVSIDDITLWVDKILSMDLQKTDEYQSVVKAGYDIYTTVIWLQSFYESIIHSHIIEK